MPLTLDGLAGRAPFSPHPATKPSSGASRRTAGALAVAALVAPYTALNVAPLEPFVRYAAGLVFAHAALGILVWAGLRRVPALGGAVSLLRAPLLRVGFATLGAATLALLLDRGRPLDWLWVVLYAPASALAQELYFRGHLLAALDELYPNAPQAAVVLQAGAFAVWHARAFLEAEGVVATFFVAGTFAAGLIWGSLVRRQGSLASSVVTHTLALVGWDALLLLQGQPIR